MTQEEKAKAYDEALERARKIHDDIVNNEIIGFPGQITDIFPELAESEDERMMREFNDWLCEEIECRTNDLRDEKDRRTLNMLCYVLGKVKDWLEKQKEEEGYDAIPVESTLEYKLGFKAGKEFEKQKEPKDPFDDEQFSRGYEAGKHDALRGQVDAFVTEYNKGFEAGRLEGITAGYNKAVKEMEQKEQKPKEPGYKHEDYFCERCQANAFNAGRESVLKEQKPVEWSEEDETMRANILNALTPNLVYSCGKGTSTGTSMYKYDKEIAWLKSIRPQWKPTEEQMEALQRAIDACESEWAYQDDELRSLLNELKKL